MRLDAKAALHYPSVRLSGVQARTVARGFGRIGAALDVGVRACAIMPDHVHLLMDRHALGAEAIAAHFKRAASRELMREGIHPLQSFAPERGRMPSCWSAGAWYVFLDSPAEVRQRIRYVEANPVDAGLNVARPIEEVYRDLSARGVKFNGPVIDDQGAVKLAYFHDPDGNALYLCEVMHSGRFSIVDRGFWIYGAGTGDGAAAAAAGSTMSARARRSSA